MFDTSHPVSVYLQKDNEAHCLFFNKIYLNSSQLALDEIQAAIQCCDFSDRRQQAANTKWNCFFFSFSNRTANNPWVTTFFINYNFRFLHMLDCRIYWLTLCGSVWWELMIQCHGLARSCLPSTKTASFLIRAKCLKALLFLTVARHCGRN